MLRLFGATPPTPRLDGTTALQEDHQEEDQQEELPDLEEAAEDLQEDHLKDAVEENAPGTEDTKTRLERVTHAKNGALIHLKNVPTSTSLKTTRRLDL